MAYASVASLIQTIDLVNYHGDSSIFPRFNDQIMSLHKHTSFLQLFLEDGDPNRAKNWEETIRDVTDRGEEIIDPLVSNSLLKSSTGSNSELDHGLDELEEVTEEMESTANRVKGISTGAKADPDAELMRIISLLLEGPPELQRIAIVGTGGVGKSTLARKAYNHPLVMEHFGARGWSTVSQAYSRGGILLDLLRSMEIETVSNLNRELVENFLRSLQGKRYLIVIQDIWSIDAWEGVRWAFQDNGSGSRIIFTTRISSLAAQIADHVHAMALLDADRSWNLLREKIFKGDPCPSRLEPFGREIVTNCGGHPLSIEVVSGILAADQTRAAWEEVSENIKIASDTDHHVLFRILSVSYTYLPHHLRPCFLYLGMFPEGEVVRVSKLVKLWVAEGFLNESGSRSSQDMGEECVEDLVRRSLVSVKKRKSDGRIKSIVVHDIVRDFCLRQVSMEKFILHGSRAGRYDQDQETTATELEWFRRVSSSDYSYDFLEGVYDSTIRTLMLCLSYGGEVGVRLSIGNARLLRILDLSNAYNYDLPEEVFELFHLRYLAFHAEFSISEAISNLENLQTLIIYPREKWGMCDSLPVGIWRMPQLRHLFNFLFKLPTRKEGENSALENLETLSTVVDFVCSKQNLEMIPNVKKLNAFYTMSFIDVVEAFELHNLVHLHKLETLEIEVLDFSFGLEHHHQKSCVFPPTLKKLNLCGLNLPWEDMKVVASLPNLQVLKLRRQDCLGKTWETSEGGFSRLNYLLIEESNLEKWITKSSHFPKLKSLVLRSCLHLSKVPREIGEIPSLELMELDGKNLSLLNSAKQIQEDRESLGDDLLQVLVLA